MENKMRPSRITSVKPTVKTNTKLNTSPFDTSELTKVHEKKYKGKEQFVTTTSFFIDQYITNKQIVSLHHAMLDLDVIHTMNNCSTQLGNTCKQTLETLKIIHTQFGINIQDDDTLKPLLDSYFVGVYPSEPSEKLPKEVPIFLNIHGDFKDYRHQFEYWVDYYTNVKNESLIKKSTTLYDMNNYNMFNYISKMKTSIANTTDQKKINKIIQQYDDMKQNKRTYYSFIYKNDFDEKGGFDVLGQPFVYTDTLFGSYTKSILKIYGNDFYFRNIQREKIKSQLFDINILIKTLEIESTIKESPPNSILVGISEYNRNHPSRYVYLNENGSFVDYKGNFFWPLYETTVFKITVNNQKKTYGVYLFQKIEIDDIGYEKFKEELVAYNYYFHYPQYRSWEETTNAVTETVKSVLFYISIGVLVDVALVYETYIQDSITSAANHSWLMLNHSKFLKDETALQHSSSTSSQLASKQHFVDHYKEMVKKQVHLNFHIAELTDSTQSFYKSLFDHHHESCMNSIQELMTQYNDYNFPTPSSFTGSPCQIAFITKWHQAFDNLYYTRYNDGIGIGDTGRWFTSSSPTETHHIFERISHHVSDIHAHNNIVNDKIVLDKYLNTLPDAKLIIEDNSYFQATFNYNMSLQDAKIANIVTSSIATYNNKNSELRKKSDKEVAAISIASEIDKSKSILEFNQFLIRYAGENPKPNLNKQSVEELEQENIKLQEKIDILNKLQQMSNSREGIEIISQ